MKSTQALYAVTKSETGNRKDPSHAAPRIVNNATASYAVTKSDPEADGRCLKAREIQHKGHTWARDKATAQVVKSTLAKYVPTKTESQSGGRCLKALNIRCRSPKSQNDEISFVEGDVELFSRAADAALNLPCTVGRFTISSATPETPRDQQV